MTTKRQRQIREAQRTRAAQVRDAAAEKLLALAEDSASWWGRGAQPRFCYCTQPVIDAHGTRGWASWVAEAKVAELVDPDDLALHVQTPIHRSVEIHKTRKAAKARAWNLWQGWRYGHGLEPGGRRGGWGTFA